MSDRQSSCDVRLDLAIGEHVGPRGQWTSEEQLRHTLKLSRECLTALEAANCRSLPLDKNSRAKLLNGAVQLARQVHAKLRCYAESLETDGVRAGPDSSTPR